MPRKIKRPVIDHAASLVLNGSTVGAAGKEIRVHPATLSKKFKEIGFKPPPGKGGPKKINLPVNDIKAMYESGHSENAVAKHFNTDRGTIRKRLLEAGVRPRTQSEAEKLKWSQMDEEARANQVKAAHDAVRGTARKLETRVANARTREARKYGHLIGAGEIEFCELLTQRGINFVHQKAAHTYNIDIAIGSVAVELSADCGRYTMFNPKEIKRAENLLECRYHVLGVEFDSVDTLIACADDILTYINLASRLKPVDREYWVVRCRMKDYTIITNNLGQFTSVPAPVEFLAKRTVVNLD